MSTSWHKEEGAELTLLILAVFIVKINQKEDEQQHVIIVDIKKIKLSCHLSFCCLLIKINKNHKLPGFLTRWIRMFSMSWNGCFCKDYPKSLDLPYFRHKREGAGMPSWSSCHSVKNNVLTLFDTKNISWMVDRCQDGCFLAQTTE